jgi:sugar lactone lactonase YvrE
MGPSGYEKFLSATTTLTSLTPGSYTLWAQPSTSTDPIVGNAYVPTVTGSPATVTAGATSDASISYAAQPISGRLWVPNAAYTTVVGFSSSQLAASGSPTPVSILGTACGCGGSHIEGASGLALDPTGGMWIAEDTDSLLYYTAAQLATGGNLAPTRVLVTTGAGAILSLAFDATGNLWSTDQAKSTLYEFSPAQLATGGTVTPAVTISSALGSLIRPWELAFDAHGNLWVASYNDSGVVGYSPSQLAASGAPVPFAALSHAKGTSGPLGVAFDGHGNLWVATIGDTVAMYTPDELTAIGSPNPAVVITSAGLSAPLSLAFDDSGNLWVANNNSGLVRFDANQIATGGHLTPAATISSSGGSLSVPNAVRFWPHAAGLPVQ